jgi:hypothetical protein
VGALPTAAEELRGGLRKDWTRAIQGLPATIGSSSCNG